MSSGFQWNMFSVTIEEYQYLVQMYTILLLQL